MNKPAENAALEAIKEYMLIQNRPYSANDVFENLHKEHGKTLVLKCIDLLVEQKVLREKLFGKQKIYFVNQDLLPICSEDELFNLDVELKSKSAELKELQDSVRTLEIELKNASNTLTTEEIKLKLKTTLQEVEAMQDKLVTLKENSSSISLQDREEICKAYDKNVKEWRSRKRMSTEVLNTILESWPKKKKELFEDIGIETDEDCKVTCPEI